MNSIAHKFTFILFLGFVVTSNYLHSQEKKAGPFTQYENWLKWESTGEVFRIEPFGPNAFRFRSTRSLRIADQDWNLLPQPETKLDISISQDKAMVKNGKIRAEIDARAGRVKYLNDKDEILLQEGSHRHDAHFARKFKSRGSDHFTLQLTFDADKFERLYGMGQYPNDCLNLKGTVLDLAQKNSQISIPFLLSNKGYGFIWNNPAVGRAELSLTHTRFVASYARQIDYVIMAGDTPEELVKKYSDLTGKPPKMPDYATGFWQSKLRYSSQDELMAIAKEYKQRNLPISVIVADFYHWPASGDWKFDKKNWPDPEAMIKKLDSMGIKLLVSIWPTVGRESENFKSLLSQNFLINPEVGNNIFLEFADMLTYIDVTHPGARKEFWNIVKSNYYDCGVRLFWLDEAEPEIDPLDYENVRYYLGNGLEVSNIYPYHFAQTFYDGQTQAGQTEIINLVRSGWIGIQRYGALLWSGDIYGTFESLRKQVKAGLNISLCGIPWWNTDIGGFYGYPEKPEYKELLIRWFQYGTFCPVMRLHGQNLPYIKKEGELIGTGGDNEVWSFGDDVYQILSHYLTIRERLRPYISKHMDRASKDGSPVMRPMFYDFPEDDACYVVEDQYMFGPDLLVAPIVEQGVKIRSVYLPAGAEWNDARNGNKYKGGQTIQIKVELQHMPVFSKNDFSFSLQ